MSRAGLGRAARQFCMTTTLHGFKYLCSEFHCDRVCWLGWCAASACCAGALCAVLWARFLQVPALLTVRSASTGPAPLPTVALCLPPTSLAYLLVGHLSTDKSVTRRLIHTFANILQGKATKNEHVMLLDTLLNAHNVSLLSALYQNMPPCHEFAKKCRWQKREIPCENLFHRELTQYGLCCVMKSNQLQLPASPMALLDSSKQFRMVLKCSDPDIFMFGCELYTMYEGEEHVAPLTLEPGAEYLGLLTFTSVRDSGAGADQLLPGSCVSSDSYSRKTCMERCMERHCGCSDPLRAVPEDERAAPPPCRLWRLACLQRTENSSCNCVPSCRKISTDLSLEYSVMTSAAHTLDPLYDGINVSADTVVKLRVSEAGSKIFTRQPTETWVTLLSSLGGVFNMFLGVGLFSALELLFLLLARVPAAAKAAPELHVPGTHFASRH